MNPNKTDSKTNIIELANITWLGRRRQALKLYLTLAPQYLKEMGLALWNLQFKKYCLAAFKLYILNGAMFHLFIFETFFLLFIPFGLFILQAVLIRPEEPILIFLYLAFFAVLGNTLELGLLMYFDVTFFYLEALFPKSFFPLFKLNTRAVPLQKIGAIFSGILIGSCSERIFMDAQNGHAADEYLNRCARHNVEPDHSEVLRFQQRPGVLEGNTKAILDLGFAASGLQK